MTILSVRKYGAITATVASLSILATVTIQPATAASFTASGNFGSVLYGGSDPLLQQLAGGSFDGTYSVTGLPIGSGSINFSSWLLNLRNGSGTILQTLSNSLPGSSAFAEQGSAYYGLGDVLAFQDASYQLQLEFAPGFTGTGAIRPGQRGSSYSAHLTRSGSSAIYAHFWQQSIRPHACAPTGASWHGSSGFP
jgi:hypothetical protein